MEMAPSTFALIPVNKLDEAKSRLSGMFSPEERKQLTLSMLSDVLESLKGIETVVISPTDLKSDIDSNFHFIKEERKEGLGKAVEKASDFAVENGAEGTLFIPADTPLLTRHHVKEIIGLGKIHPLIISPSSRGGTGILYRRPPDVIGARFTSQSFSDHKKEAKKRGVAPFIYDSFELSLDIDLPEDIYRFLHHKKPTRTYEFLISLLDFPRE